MGPSSVPVRGGNFIQIRGYSSDLFVDIKFKILSDLNGWIQIQIHLNGIGSDYNPFGMDHPRVSNITSESG